MVDLPFRPGRLTLGGYEVLRAQVSRSGSETEDHLGWYIDVLRPAERKDGADLPFLAMSDLHTFKDGTFVGATLASHVQLPPRHRVADVETAPLREAIAELFGEMLWDSCSLIVRQLAAMSRVDVGLPKAMPHSGKPEQADPCDGQTEGVSNEGQSPKP